MQDVDPYADFERIFSAFASAEEVTGAKVVKEEDEEDGEDAGAAATSKPAVPLPCYFK